MQQWTTVQDDACQSSFQQQTNGSRARRLQSQDEPSGLPSLPISKKRSHNVGTRISELDDACSALAHLLAGRVQEFQALTGFPLKGRRRTPAELSSLLDQAEKAGGGGATWQALGMTSSPFSPTITLPDWCRKDVWGPMDLLLALAGHLPNPSSSSSSSSNPITLSNQGSAVSQHRAGLKTSSQPSSQSRVTHSPATCPSLINNQWSHAGNITGQESMWNGYLPGSISNLTWLPCIKDIQHANADYLREFLSDLRPKNRHIGVDDRSTAWFREMKVQAAATLLDHPDSSLCRGFARFGVPHAYRPGIWQAALGLLTEPISEVDKSHFESLVHEACCQPLLCDAWVQAGCQAVCDSEQFFLFGEVVRSVLLAFYRDDKIRHACGDISSTPAFAIASDRESLSTNGISTSNGPTSTGSVSFPPSGVLPIQGMSLMVGPLCFMYQDPAAVYRMHRTLYCRYWCRLCGFSSVGPPSPALPSLLRTYEALLQTLDPELVLHLGRLGVPPTAISIPWISRAFAGYLPVEEVLLLWDRVIGLDSLLPVALLAVAVMCFRRQVLMSCSASKEVLDVMSDLSQMQTVPLLQAVLFHG